MPCSQRSMPFPYQMRCSFWSPPSVVRRLMKAKILSISVSDPHSNPHESWNTKSGRLGYVISWSMS